MFGQDMRRGSTIAAFTREIQHLTNALVEA
jgi:hypothetical protein